MRVTCASRLFNENDKEELIRSRTGHTSDALSRYEKANREQELKVSKLLGPPKTDEDVHLNNKSEVLPENTEVGKRNRTPENDISEFAALMEDYIVSEDLLSIELPADKKAEGDKNSQGRR